MVYLWPVLHSPWRPCPAPPACPWCLVQLSICPVRFCLHFACGVICTYLYSLSPKKNWWKVISPRQKMPALVICCNTLTRVCVLLFFWPLVWDWVYSQKQSETLVYHNRGRGPVWEGTNYKQNFCFIFSLVHYNHDHNISSHFSWVNLRTIVVINQ